MSITNPSCSRRYWKKSRANCYTRTDPFFPPDLYALWLTLALLLMASILAMGGEFLVEAICSPNCCQYNCTQGKNHRHLSKSGAQIRFPQKKRGQMKEEFYFLMYQRTIWVSLSRNIQISSLFFTGTFKSGICSATTVVARKGKLLDSDPTLPQNF